MEPQAFDMVRRNLNRANVFAFGIGSSVNRFLIEGLARVGQGEPFIVTKAAEAAAVAERFRTYIQTPVLTGITLDYDGFDAYDVEPQSLPDILAERPVVVFGKWRGSPTGAMTLRGYQGEHPYTDSIDVAGFKPMPGNVALRYLWARNRIATLGDYNTLRATDERVAEMTQLGLRYNLLTQYTSFVAVDHVVRHTSGNPVTVKQPIPLPQGVSNHAVGQNVPTTPEPEVNALIAVLAFMLLWHAYRKGWIPQAAWFRSRRSQG